MLAKGRKGPLFPHMIERDVERANMIKEIPALPRPLLMPGTHTVHLSPLLLSAIELISIELHTITLFSRLLRKRVACCCSCSFFLDISPKTATPGESPCWLYWRSLQKPWLARSGLQTTSEPVALERVWARWLASPGSFRAPMSVSRSEMLYLKIGDLLEGLWKCILRRQL